MIKFYPGLTVAGAEKEIILGAIKFYGNKEAAASAIGLSVRTVQDRVKQYAEEDAAAEAARNAISRPKGGENTFSTKREQPPAEKPVARKPEGIHPVPPPPKKS